MKVIVVGAGGTTRELLRRLGELWDVVLVDTDEGRLVGARGLRSFEEVVGDGSSALVLRRAGLADADALVAATGDDDVNLEAARIAREAGLLRVVAVTGLPERSADYLDLDVVVVSPASDAARKVELQLEPRRINSTAFAAGKAEGIEFEVSPDSTVAGKALKDLYAETWIVAAILREGELIVPHGETTIQPGDRVTVVGAAKDFGTIVKTFTAGESRFPLNFGRKVAVAMSSASDLDGPVSEALSLVRNSRAEELLVVHPDPEGERIQSRAEEIEELLGKLEVRAEGVVVAPKAVKGSPSEALVETVDEESVGLLVVPAPTGGFITGRLRTAGVVNTYAPAGVPVLLSRGRHPYSSVVVPARRTIAGEAAGRAGIDLAQASGATLVGVAVVAPSFVGDDDLEDARESAAWLRQEAAVQGVQVQRRVRQGNPVRIVEESAHGASLVVLGMPGLPLRAFRPGISGHLARRLDTSVLLVPLS